MDLLSGNLPIAWQEHSSTMLIGNRSAVDFGAAKRNVFIIPKELEFVKG